MKKYLSILFVLTLTLNTFVFAQDEGEETEISTVEALLQLVKEGKTKEQSANADREAKFMANKNEQAAILAAEKRELARQERIADQLEAEYKKNEEILRVKEEAYLFHFEVEMKASSLWWTEDPMLKAAMTLCGKRYQKL